MATSTPFEARQMAEAAAEQLHQLAGAIRADNPANEVAASLLEQMAEVYDQVVDDYDQMMQN